MWRPAFTWHAFRFMHITKSLINSTSHHNLKPHSSHHDVKKNKNEKMDRNEKMNEKFKLFSLKDMMGLRIQHDFPLTSHFKCSNTLINQIHAITINSFKNNLIGGVQSDCPHRFISLLTFLFDFIRKIFEYFPCLFVYNSFSTLFFIFYCHYIVSYL